MTSQWRYKGKTFPEMTLFLTMLVLPSAAILVSLWPHSVAVTPCYRHTNCPCSSRSLSPAIIATGSATASVIVTRTVVNRFLLPALRTALPRLAPCSIPALTRLSPRLTSVLFTSDALWPFSDHIWPLYPLTPVLSPSDRLWPPLTPSSPSNPVPLYVSPRSGSVYEPLQIKFHLSARVAGAAPLGRLSAADTLQVRRGLPRAGECRCYSAITGLSWTLVTVPDLGYLIWRSGVVVAELDCGQTASKFFNNEDGLDCQVYHITMQFFSMCIFMTSVYIITRFHYTPTFSWHFPIRNKRHLI